MTARSALDSPRWRSPAPRALTALLATLVASCGGGGTSTPPIVVGSQLNDASCYYQYTLPGTVVPIMGADPLFGQLWHLQNTGQGGGVAGEDIRAVPAWSVTKGSGVRIAVLDDGVELFHDDLTANLIAGASFDYRPARYGGIYPLPCAINNDHGTQVTGVLAARDSNATGVAGVAPRAGFVAYNVLAATTVSNIANALTRDGQNNAVYNNSWGSPDDVADGGGGILHRIDTSFAPAIAQGIANGRGGKGSIYMFPAGNGGCFANNSLGVCQNDNSNFDGYLTHRGVNPICAVDDRGKSPWWAEGGANVLVCAPSSGDRNAPLGYISTTAVGNTYSNEFSGTSASTPMASGVAALMLAANPNLSWRDVRIVLAKSARRNDATDPGWTTNFGLNHHPRYAFGVINAQAAVALATGWASVGTSATLASCAPLGASGSTVNISLPDAPPVGSPIARTDSVTVSSANCPAVSTIEQVEVDFEATHAYGGDLRVELVSPNGLVSVLANERICDGAGDACGAYSPAWTFASVRHLEEPSGGNWTLRVTDAQNGDTGTWVRWNLRFWGR